MIGLTDQNEIVRFSSATPGTLSTPLAITGITAGESIVGIDFRAATGQLFGLGVNPTTDTGTVYRIDPQTAAATTIGAASGIAYVDSMGATIDLPDPATVGYGFDFNPVADRIRVVTGSGLNFRANQNDGTPVDGNSGSMGTQPDSNINGAVTAADGSAYTNSSGSPTATTLYALDSGSNSLYVQNLPNAGTETLPLTVTLGGATLDFSSVNGFDIPGYVSVAANNAAVTSGNAFAVLGVGGVNKLYSIDLATGAATDLGAVGAGTGALRGLAVGLSTVK
jgi:hypothetical protein